MDWIGKRITNGIGIAKSKILVGTRRENIKVTQSYRYVVIRLREQKNGLECDYRKLYGFLDFLVTELKAVQL